MISFAGSNKDEQCTVIETIQGEVKLIRRYNGFYSYLETLKFPTLKDCMEYIDRNRFRVNIFHSGKRKSEEVKK